MFGCNTARAIEYGIIRSLFNGSLASKYAEINVGRQHVDVNIFHVNPFEQVCVTFEKSINQGPLLLRKMEQCFLF